MQNEKIEELVKAHIERTVSPEALALAKGLRSMNPLRTRLPIEGQVVVAEEVFGLHTPEDAPSTINRSSSKNAADHQPAMCEPCR